MDLTSTPESLTCSECGETVEETGYLPAMIRDEEYDPQPDEAVCDACGFNEIGMMGCAPDLNEVIDPRPDDTLLYVRLTDEGIDVISTKQ